VSEELQTDKRARWGVIDEQTVWVLLWGAFVAVLVARRQAPKRTDSWGACARARVWALQSVGDAKAHKMLVMGRQGDALL
jgi:hypothetical protein